MDNALPHLDSDAAIAMALGAMHARLRPGGKVVFSLRDDGHRSISRQTDHGWAEHSFIGRYRAVTCEETAALAQAAGVADVRVLAPAATGFYQPIRTAIRPQS